MSHFSIKLSFRNNQCYRVEIGDFGPAEKTGNERHAEQPPCEDCLLTWPVDPMHVTGARGLVEMLRDSYRIPLIDAPRVVDLRA